MNNTLQSQIFRGFFFLILLFPLFAGTLNPQPPISFAHGTDIIAHWGGFFMVSVAMFAIARKRIFLMLIFLLGLAVVLEAAQFFIDGRQVSAADMIANLFGVVCAIAVYNIMRALGKQTSRI